MNDSRAIAIIGMSCSFPGSPDLASFWRTIRDGSVHFREVPADRWDHAACFSPNRREPDMTYGRKIACLEDIRSFAPERYGIPARRAYLMDPQQRLILDQTRGALDDAGYGGRPLPRSTGVYMGASVSEYKDLIVARLRARQILGGQWGDASALEETAVKAAVGDLATIQQYSIVGGQLNMIACNVSDAFDLHGPALVMDTACSSALMAAHEAVLHLRERICDAAIVGGVHCIGTPDLMIGFSKVGALSRSDACRPFDQEADGFVLGEGAGVIVLKRLEDALRGGDRVWAVIRGVGLSNDGCSDGPMTPRLGGQLEALAHAYLDAGVSPDTVGYIEAHGTATPVGDLNEISALRQNAQASGRGPVACAIGSVKGNIGHTLAAAGIAGIIKSVLVLDHGVIPPQAGLQTPREALGLEGSGFYLPASPRSFDSMPGSPRRVAVNSFGFGGTNVHVVLEEPRQPVRISTETGAEPNTPQLFVISAATLPLLAQYLRTLAGAVERSTAALHDLAFTLTVTRRVEDERVAFVASSKEELREKLLSALSMLGEGTSAEIEYRRKLPQEARRDVAFVFAGEAEWAPEYFGKLSSQFPAFRSRLDALAAKLNGALEKPLASCLVSPGESLNPREMAKAVHSARNGAEEPVLAAAVQIALSEFVGELGLRPQATIGTGLAEKVAAAASGALDANAALHLVAEHSRGASQHSSPRGLIGDEPSWEKHNSEMQKGFRALQATGTNLFLQIGREEDFPDTALSFKFENTEKPVQILSLLAKDDSPASGLLKTIGRLVIMGIPLDLGSLYGDARPVSLPSAALPTRTFWVADSKRRPASSEAGRKAPANGMHATPASAVPMDSAIEPQTETAEVRAAPMAQNNNISSPLSNEDPPGSGQISAAQVAKPVNPGIGFVAPAEAPSVAQIQRRVIELIAEVSACPIEQLGAEQRLGVDLGFDSLMGVDLYVRLTETFVEVRDLPQSMIGGETTIEELVQSIAALIARAAQVTTHAGDEIVRYAVVCVDRSLQPRTERGELPFVGRILLIADSLGVAGYLASRLAEAGRVVDVISPNGELDMDGETAVIDLSGLGPVGGLDSSLLRKCVLRLLQRTDEIRARGITPTAFIVAHSGTRTLGLAGAVKAKAREWPKSVVKAVEIAPDTPPDRIAQTIFEELKGSDQSVEVSYTTGRRQAPVLRRNDIDAHPLPDSAVVVISGGARGLGAKLAVELARRNRARLLLLGRSPSASVAIQSIRDAGGEAVYVQCDVRNPAEVHDAFQQCRELFGPIDYVVHAAGVVADGVGSGPDKAAATFDTKVAGALALWDAARPDPLKTFLMYGSWAGRFGNANQYEYSAANHALGRLATLLGNERCDARVVALDLPPWEGTGMVNAMLEEARSALRKRVRFLTDDAGIAHVIAELSGSTESGEVILGAGLEDEPFGDRMFLPFSSDEYPWLEDHRLEGKIAAPFAFLLDQAAAAAGRLGLGPAVSLSNAQIFGDATPPADGSSFLEVVASAIRSYAEIEINLVTGSSRLPLMRVGAAKDSLELPLLTLPPGGKTPGLPVAEFYQQRTFHGPRFRALGSVMEIGPSHAVGALDARAIGRTGGAVLDILSLDAMLQLCAYWSSVTIGRIGLPISAKEVRVLGRPQANVPTCIVGILEDTSGDLLTASLDLVDSKGYPLVQIRQLCCRLMSQLSSPLAVDHQQGPSLSDDIDPANWQIERFPEVRALQNRIESTRNSGLTDPYFSVHEGVTNDTSVIGGQEYVNFASYNYLGLSGDTEVTASAVEALHKYGTSVSASRLASGEKPLHRELEREIAEFLGCEDAIVMVGGHATNVSVIGHLFGPQDLVIHDSLAHDSILAGIKLGGAKRRSFPHNDLDTLDNILRQSRSAARRVLIAVEGVYSMDGDVPRLEAIIEIKQRHRALLLVDEAHSLGILGDTGRGIGEHCDVKRQDVDLWMGTLSKSLASCGGYIAGSAELVRYLKYSNPGFVYSVGISPANAAAALAALRKLRAHPELVTVLRSRSRLFCALSQKRGIDTGFSGGTAIVPCIVGNSLNCLLLARALEEQKINVQPILYPAVEESLTRLRFFVTTRHSEQQITTTVNALADALREISPNLLKHSSTQEGLQRTHSLHGG
jgi:8-amino-7-oxononanoate synthase